MRGPQLTQFILPPLSDKSLEFMNIQWIRALYFPLIGVGLALWITGHVDDALAQGRSLSSQEESIPSVIPKYFINLRPASSAQLQEWSIEWSDTGLMISASWEYPFEAKVIKKSFGVQLIQLGWVHLYNLKARGKSSVSHPSRGLLTWRYNTVDKKTLFTLDWVWRRERLSSDERETLSALPNAPLKISSSGMVTYRAHPSALYLWETPSPPPTPSASSHPSVHQRPESPKSPKSPESPKSPPSNQPKLKL
jgi:hypothetical protein